MGYQYYNIDVYISIINPTITNSTMTEISNKLQKCDFMSGYSMVFCPTTSLFTALLITAWKLLLDILNNVYEIHFRVLWVATASLRDHHGHIKQYRLKKWPWWSRKIVIATQKTLKGISYIQYLALLMYGKWSLTRGSMQWRILWQVDDHDEPI